ncbi:hypothetical protein [Amycolatopsis nigrescens]|uniref:hypothetical protein n=1 Tax=Amycolatopsis nigrescens TaxID=381445 RepID=UPI000378B6E3|nr:hypothetical protein [Amycolatopsis nigrescens]
MTGPDSWKTPEIRAAEAKLAAAEAGLEQAISRAKEVDRNIPKTGLSKQDIEQIEAFAKSKDAPKELRELQKRIDDGDLSWQDIAGGRHLDDPQVRNALSGSTPDLRRAYTMIQEGDQIDDVIESAPQSAYRRSERADDEDEDNGEEDGGVLRREW